MCAPFPMEMVAFYCLFRSNFETWKEILHLSVHRFLKRSTILVILQIYILCGAVSGRKYTETKKELMPDISPFCSRNSSMQNMLKSALKNRNVFSFFPSFNFSWAVRSIKAIAKVIKTKKPTQTQKLVVGKVNLLKIYLLARFLKRGVLN